MNIAIHGKVCILDHISSVIIIIRLNKTLVENL